MRQINSSINIASFFIISQYHPFIKFHTFSELFMWKFMGNSSFPLLLLKILSSGKKNPDQLNYFSVFLKILLLFFFFLTFLSFLHKKVPRRKQVLVTCKIEVPAVPPNLFPHLHSSSLTHRTETRLSWAEPAGRSTDRACTPPPSPCAAKNS